MCAPHMALYCAGYMRITRPAIRCRRIHAFAAMRWADAKTPGAMKFWKAVMDSCIKQQEEWQPIPGLLQHRRPPMR